MMERETEPKQKTIKLPRVLLDQLDQYLAENPQLGYLSSSEFIRECIRKKMREEFLRK